MNQKRFYAYIRVSTQKQGEEGVSLQEQKAAIERYAREHDFEIVRWFEEQESAAKGGRPIFNEVLKLLRQKKADGLIIHKIDRTARNLRDWVDFIELTEQGLELHIASENRDLSTLGGRLISDIEATLAAHYSRNLREEVKKGMYGRLKQGLWPWAAPWGYLDMGGGKIKEIDPVKGPLIQKLFELYATGKYTLRGGNSIAEEIGRLGLLPKSGAKVSFTTISKILNNPFYIGILRIQKSGETYEGIHQPLIAKETFDRVQEILHGRTHRRSIKHNHLFRLLFKCASCRYSLRGELHKGKVYYRCHNPACPITSAREDQAHAWILNELKNIPIRGVERDYPRKRIQELEANWQERRIAHANALKIRLGQVADKLNRLTDAFLEQTLDKESFEARKAALVIQRKDLEEKLELLQSENASLLGRIREVFAWLERPNLGYELGSQDEKREVLKKVWLNRNVDRKKLDFVLAPGFDLLKNRLAIHGCAPEPDLGRIWDELFPKLVDWIISDHITPPHFSEEASKQNLREQF